MVEKLSLRKMITFQLVLIVSTFMLIVYAVSIVVLVSTEEKMYTKAKEETLSSNLKVAEEYFEGAFSTYQFTEFCAAHQQEVEIQIDSNDEAINKEKQLFKVDGMLKCLNGIKETNPNKILECVKESVEEFVGDAPQFDDLNHDGYHFKEQ